MNIILDKSLKTDSKQPKVFELGQITTTLQDLLDNSTIVINGEQTIILSVIDENDNVLKYLLPLDYKGESFYGLGKDILETDLISLGSLETKPYKVYTALLTQSGTNAPVAEVVENTLGFTPTFIYQEVGDYASQNVEWFDFMDKKVLCFKNEAILGISNIVKINYNYEDGVLSIFTYNNIIASNDMLSDVDNYFRTSIEIRVYD